MNYEICYVSFLSTRQKEASTSRTLRLSMTLQSGHLHSLGTLLVRDPSVLAALLAFLAVSDLLHLFDSKSDRL